MKYKIKQDMEVIGADGIHVGTVDLVEGDRIRLKTYDSHGQQGRHHHYVERSFIADVEGDKIRLSAKADIAVKLEEEKSGRPVNL